MQIIGDLTGTGSELAFCKETGGELKANVCQNEGSTCQGLASDDGIKNFCACTSLNVPPIPSLGELVSDIIKNTNPPSDECCFSCIDSKSGPTLLYSAPIILSLEVFVMK